MLSPQRDSWPTGQNGQEGGDAARSYIGTHYNQQTRERYLPRGISGSQARGTALQVSGVERRPPSLCHLGINMKTNA